MWPAKVVSDEYVAVDPVPGPPATPGVVWPFSAVTIPDWLIAAVLLVPTVRWLCRLWLRRWRRRRGLCPQRGYDLRGSAGRCPECGADVKTALPAAA